MATEIEITNLALSKIGEDAITSFADDSTAARLALLGYGVGRDAVLRDHLWNFAMRRESLSALATAPEWGFTYQYELPSDCLRLIEVYNPSRCDYQIEERKILTDLSAPLQIRYTARVTAAEQFDSLFVDALATYLAAEWAERITGSVTKSEQLTALYREKIQTARTMDGQENPAAVIDASEWIDARF